MRLLAIEQTRSPQGKLRLRFDSGEAMLVLPAVVADLSLRPGMDIPDAARASLEAAAGSASAKERAVRILSAATVSRAELEHRLRQKGESPRTPGRPSNGLTGSPCSMTRPQPGRSSAAARQRATARHASGRCSTPSTSRASCGTRLLPSSRSRTTRSTHFYRSGSAAGSPTGTEIRRAADALLRRGHAWGDIRRALERYDPDLPEE